MTRPANSTRISNAAFAEKWKTDTGETVTIQTSHGGSGKQARSVIDGLEADVRDPGSGSDIDAIAKESGKIPADWKSKFENNSAPYTSHDRLPGAQGQSEGHQGLGRSGQGRHPGDHAKPEDLGRRTLELPGPAWAWARARNGGDDTRHRNMSPISSSMFRSSTPAPAARPRAFVQRGLGAS